LPESIFNHGAIVQLQKPNRSLVTVPCDITADVLRSLTTQRNSQPITDLSLSQVGGYPEAREMATLKER